MDQPSFHVFKTVRLLADAFDLADFEEAAIVRVLFHIREGANLGFERLVVLPLDLQFGLEFLDQQVQVSNLDA